MLKVYILHDIYLYACGIEYLEDRNYFNLPKGDK